MKDESILKNTESNIGDATYINDCVKEVCLNGDSLTKYKRMIEKQYGAEFYQKCSNFVKEVKRSAKRGKFTQTSLTNLQYLANEIGVSSATIGELVKKYTQNGSEVTKTPVRKNNKREKKGEKLTDEFAVMKKVTEAERKRLEREAESLRLQEEEEKKKLREREERRERAAERRRQKKEEEEKQRRDEERKRKEELKQIQKDIEQQESIKTVIKWIGIIAAVIVWLSIDGTGWIYAAVILGIVYFLVKDEE